MFSPALPWVLAAALATHGVVAVYVWQWRGDVEEARTARTLARQQRALHALADDLQRELALRRERRWPSSTGA